jgi:SAM-dependent methyltransferase
MTASPSQQPAAGSPPATPTYDDVLRANVEIHTQLSGAYNEVEPHYRPESRARVRGVLAPFLVPGADGRPPRVLDLGCGTGFVIDLVKREARRVVGVDATPAMLARVDREGGAEVELIEGDTGRVDLPEASFELATAYSFLDHLFDRRPTYRTAFRALVPGGTFYADLCPNGYFWDAIRALPRETPVDPIVQREVDAVYGKAEEVAREHGVSPEAFTLAEYSKHVLGGFREDDLRAELLDVGFSEVRFVYHWFLGQAQLVNDPERPRERNLEDAARMDAVLRRGLPVTRHLFKYVGFLARK